jgi:hypothetical protein
VPELLAVCVVLPKEVAWRGNTVRTGVWNQTVDGPHMVRHLGVRARRRAGQEGLDRCSSGPHT